MILEGRAQTLDHIRSPFRFELTMRDPQLIGQRRAAQRMIGEVVQKFKGEEDGAPADEAVVGELAAAVVRMVGESS